MSGHPAVSIIIPTYNRTELACSAITSVFEQTCSDYELLVVDDGSEQPVGAIEALVCGRGHRFFRLAHQGVSAARNFGAAQAVGRWLAFLDSDDRWYPRKLEAQLEYLAAHPDLLICQTKEDWIRSGRRVNPKHRHAQPDGEAFERSLELCCISPSSVMIDRLLFEKTGGFDLRLPVCEDYDLWLRITAEYPVGLVPSALICKLGGHSDQLSRSVPAMDRFRVFSMVKLLGRVELSDAQRLAVFEELRHKLVPLTSGAGKRGNVDLSSVYRRLNEVLLSMDEAGAHEFSPAPFLQLEEELLTTLTDFGIC